MPHSIHPPNGSLSQWISDQFEPGYEGHAIDVGASDGKSISTTWLLEKFHRWTVLCVEPNPEFHAMLLRERAFVERCACDSTSGIADFHIHSLAPEAFSALRVANHPKQKAEPGCPWHTLKVRVETAERLLAKWEFPKLDAFCVDVEGNERDVLEGFDLARWKPRVLVVETWDVGTMDEYLAGFGYERRWRTAHNDCFVLKETS